MLRTSTTFLQAILKSLKAITLVLVYGGIVVLIGLTLFWNANRIMEAQLKERLQSTAEVAAMQFSAENVMSVRGIKDKNKPAFRTMVEKLNALRDAVPGISSTYILRKTDDPDLLMFVADADSLLTFNEADTNKNGNLEPGEVPTNPGDFYDATQAPAMFKAFQGATTDDELTVDQWGTTISGYAPIRKPGTQEAVAIIGLDMRADEYLFRLQSILPPLSLFLLVIGAGVLAAYAAYMIAEKKFEEVQMLDRERAGLMLLTFHQLGAPLTIFKWSLEALQMRGKGESAADAITEHVRNMQQGIARMDDMINDLKLAAQVQENRIDVTLNHADVQDIVFFTTESFRPIAESQGLTLTVDAPKPLPARTDASLLADILHQLLTNAVNFTQRGGKITVRAHTVGRSIQIDIVDTGAGIPKEDQKRLFGKFVRGSNAPLFKPDGNGLGLFIARGLAEALGGTLWIKSLLGKGTTVSVKIPV